MNLASLDRASAVRLLPLSPDQEPQPPKLVAFSIADGELVFRHEFSGDAGLAGR